MPRRRLPAPDPLQTLVGQILTMTADQLATVISVARAVQAHLGGSGVPSDDAILAQANANRAAFRARKAAAGAGVPPPPVPPAPRRPRAPKPAPGWTGAVPPPPPETVGD